MPTQLFAANGELVPRPAFIMSEDLRRLGLPCEYDADLPNGLWSIDFAEGLVEVVRSPNAEPTKMRIGKFLKQHNADDDLIQNASSKLTEIKTILNSSFEITTSSDEVEYVYRNGPQSCMKTVDAVRVYDTEDVAVAYIRIGAEVIARSVVCINEDIGKHYVRCYGFVEPLVKLLEANGFVKGTLEGCKLKLIKDSDDNILMPYLDGCCNVDVHDDHIEVTKYGDYEAQQTEGYLFKTCPCCGEMVDPNDSYYSEYLEETLCECCFSDTHVYIDGEHYHVDSDEIQELEDGEYVLKEDAAYVEYRGEWLLREDCYYNDYTDEYLLKEDIS